MQGPDVPEVFYLSLLGILTSQVQPPLCRALMCLNELSVVSEMGDVTRNGLFPTAEEVAALSLQFAVPAGLEEADMGEQG